MPDSLISSAVWVLTGVSADQLARAQEDAEPTVAEMLATARTKLNEAIDWLIAANAE